MLVGFVAMVVGASSFVGGLLAAPIDFAVPPPPKSALLLADDGRTQFATIRPQQRRDIVPATDIPMVMRQAIIGAEDARFLEHKGVDPIATIRAAYRDLTGGRTQGGSTLTQQYVKNVYVGNDRTAMRKIKEAALAVRLENRLSKDEILTDYLNVLYLGNNVSGVQAASRYYYGVDVKDLDKGPGGARDPVLALARASMLAGIAPAPSAWNPVKDFTTARLRQRYTLNQMITLGFTTPETASAAFRKSVKPVKEALPELPTDAPEFADLVKAQVQAKFKSDAEQAVFQSGLRVRTTMDNDLQTAAARALREVLPGGSDAPEAAIAAIDIRTGDVRAMSTLPRHPAKTFPKDPKTGKAPPPRPALNGYQRNGLNLATSAYRSTGSTIKPFTLAVALEEGHTLGERRFGPQCLKIRTPVTKEEPDGFYRPCNAGDSESGTFSLRTALVHSVNTIYIPLAKEVGRQKIRDLMLEAGVKVPTDKKTGQPQFSPNVNSFGLGTTAEVTPLSLANAYAALVNHGVHTAPRFYSEIRVGGSPDEPGDLLNGYTPKVTSNRVLPAKVADDVADAMHDVVESGTGRAAKQPFPVYGKTGTTNDAKDAWFVGCVREPQYVCIATWMGYEDHGPKDKPMRDIYGVHGLVFGGTLPAKVFARTFEILREIQADRKTRLSGKPAPSPTPSVRKRRRTRSPSPFVTRAPSATSRPVQSPQPQPSPSRPPILPSTAPEPSQPSGPGPPG
ncbi:MAG: penicillin-binding protein [Actinomycetota bacterium]|nr:penicillin-binding protein [Actinomycetota bacterium]